ncbi:MAG: hypothetical protein V3W34_17610 [Phycisphaerae bacterium]
MLRTIGLGFVCVALAAALHVCGCRVAEEGGGALAGAVQSNAARESTMASKPSEVDATLESTEGDDAPRPGENKPIAVDRGSLQLYVEDERVFVVSYRDETVGGSSWRVLLSYDGTTRIEEFGRSLFTTGIDNDPYRFTEREKQSIEHGQLKLYWSTLNDDIHGGRFRVHDMGEDARIKSTYGGKTVGPVPFAAPKDYVSAVDVAAWCAEHRDDQGRSLEYSRPLWFVKPPRWGTMVITSEGEQHTTTVEGQDVQAWRFRVHCKSVNEVYALLWLDKFNKLVRRELPYCGLSFVMSTSGWADLSDNADWSTARQRWGIDGVGPVPEIIAEAHRRLLKKEGGGGEVEGRSEKDPAPSPSGTDADVARLALFHLFL